MPAKTTTSISKEKPIVHDYAYLLEAFGFVYELSGPYYQVGEIKKMQGWMLHLSSIWTETQGLLETILPVLQRYQTPFKIIRDRREVNKITSGNLGLYQLGKVVCIYPSTDELGKELAKELIPLTKSYAGCTIPTDFHLGGIVYTRYGSFNPRLVWDQNGNVERYIQDLNGQFIKDEYSTPFKFPKGIPWPFGELAQPQQEVVSTFLKDTYKVIRNIKNDAKGRVMKSLRIKGFNVQWIIIKEAKHGVFTDTKSRDICDRLRWQFELQRHLQTTGLVPKVYDFFEEKGNAYLVMEYIKGIPLGDHIIGIYQSGIWFKLATSKKLRIIDLLLQVINVVDQFHREGYVHRDINGVNFILNRSNQLIAIDLELAFSLNEKKPLPPFALGTPGFISPEQNRIEEPKVEQDIYSLGTLMILFFTNLLPDRFAHQEPTLIESLSYFIRNNSIAHLIAKCLSEDPEQRPDISEIKIRLEDFKNELEGNTIDETIAHKRIEESSHNSLIQAGINALVNSSMIGAGKLWFSNETKENGTITNQNESLTWYPGFYAGASGIMYTIALAKLQGFNVEATKEAFEQGFRYLQNNFLASISTVLPGLYYGSCGVALALSKGLVSGLIDDTHKPMVEKALDLPMQQLNVAHGLAGQGLAALNCADMISDKCRERILDRCISRLLENQLKDGSWFMQVPASNTPIRYTGFSQGVAGIIYFLLACYERNQDEHLLKAILKGLSWLKRQAKKQKNGMTWYTASRSKQYDRYLSNGTAGIALTFAKAFQKTGDYQYKKLGEGALSANPHHFMHPNFTLANGIAGLALVYLFAAQAFQNEEWKERADFIKNTIIHTGLGDENARYWMLENNKVPTADLMEGNSGILYFLLRYASSNKEDFFL